MAESQKKQGNNSGLKMLIVLLLAAIWILALIMLALILAPTVAAVPEFEISDKTGDWESQGTVAVFDEMIYPGSSGEYDFVLHSLSDGDLRFYIEFEEYYTGKNIEDWYSFMLYRIKMNGKHMEDSEWHTIDELVYDDITILADSRQVFTLEWWWPFESGHDGEDTNIGWHSGEYTIVFQLHAEVIE